MTGPLPSFRLLLAGVAILFASPRVLADFHQADLRQEFDAAKCKDAIRCLDFIDRNLPAEDRTNNAVTSDLVRDNIDFALRARAEFSWCRQLPKSIFLNDVLPYAVADEARDPWRREFFEKFSPVVKNCNDAADAVRAIQQHIVAITGVNYNTRRRAPNQSPRESMASGMASCSGLSILMIDVCRAVGIPARLAGVRTWTDGSGNHNWVEVWVDGAWHFTEYYPDKNGFDHGWLLGRLAGVTGSDPATAVWASSWEKTGDWFPLVWRDPADKFLPGVNVTARYLKLARDQHPADAGTGLRLRVTVLDANGRRASAHLRVTTRASGKEILLAEGDSPSAHDDLNHHLEFLLPPGTTVKITAAGRATTQIILPATAPNADKQPLAVELKLAP
jgi:hypothetical protein